MNDQWRNIRVSGNGDKSLDERLDEMEERLERSEERLAKVELWQAFVLGIVSCASFAGGVISVVVGWYLTWKK